MENLVFTSFLEIKLVKSQSNMSTKFKNPHLFLLLLILAAYSLYFFLLVGFFHLPPALNHDGSWSGLYATRILQGEPFTLFVPEEYGQETTYLYSLAIITLIMGSNQEAIILTGFLWSLIAISGTFLLTKELTNNKTVLIAGGLLYAFSCPLFVYSVSGWRLISLIALTPFSMWAVMRYQKKLSYMNSFLLGFFSATLMYTYHAGRAQLVFLVLYLGVRVLEKRSKNELKHAFLALIIFSLVFLPMAITAISDVETWMGRATALSSNHNYLEKTLIALKFYNFSANGNDFFISTPVMDFPLTILWIAGFLVSFLKFKKYWPLVLAFFIFLLPAIVSEPSFHRAIGTYTIVISFVVVFLEWLRLKIKNSRFFAGIVLVIFILFFSSIYQRMIIEEQPFQLGFYREATAVGKVLRNYYHSDSSPDNIIILANNWPKDLLSFLATPNNPQLVLLHNYQGYEYQGHDATEYLIDDLASKKLNLSKYTLVVESSKATIFVDKLSKTTCSATNIDSIEIINSKTSELIPVAEIFSLHCR